MQLGNSYVHSEAIYTACKLNLADEIADRTKNVDILAEELNLHVVHLNRLMQALTKLGVFVEDQPRQFSNSPLGHTLRAAHPHSVKAGIMFFNHPKVRHSFASLEDTIRSGNNAIRRNQFKSGISALLDDEPELARLYDQYLTSAESLSTPILAEDGPWKGVQRIIDVGNGFRPSSLSFSLLKGGTIKELVVADRPVVIEQAQNLRDSYPELSEKIMLSPVDIFEGTQLPQAKGKEDVYLLTGMTHHLSTTDLIDLLTSIRVSLGHSGARVFLLDKFNENGVTLETATLDLSIMATEEGQYRSVTELQSLCGVAGLQATELKRTRAPERFLVLSPAPDSLS